MKERHSWILLLPLLLFATGVWLYSQTQNEVRVEMLRAERHWREKKYEQAIGSYDAIQEKHPGSRYADDSLFEIGRICYVNLYDVPRAVSYFQKVVDHYPNSPVISECYRQLAEIHELELDDVNTAVGYWERALSVESSTRQRRQTQFRVASALLKLDRFEEARHYLERILAVGINDHLNEQASVGVGTILQMRKDYARSVPYFQKVARGGDCQDCKVQAQLGLVESYQFLNDLSQALDVAQSIRSTTYPESLRQDLLKRLREKIGYEPKLWNGNGR